MQQYVLGFMFNNIGEVLLIRKNRPSFQAGRLNGLGGHIEPNERPDDAMVREFREECGLETTREDWKLGIILQGEEFKVYVYSSHGKIREAKTLTDEHVWAYPVNNVINDIFGEYKSMPSLKWQIPILLDKEIKGPVMVEYA